MNRESLEPAYNQNQENRVTLEKLREVFSYEKLPQITTQEYIHLLRIHKGPMLTHVVRQGLRDHANSMWHTSGINEVSDGFKKVLEDKSFKSRVAIDGKGDGLLERVEGYTKLSSAKSRYEACNIIRKSFDYSLFHSDTFADASAVHFAASVVLDGMYGGESGNEIFFVLPAVVGCSQSEYSGRIHDGNFDQHNDVWVYADIEKGIPVDAGFCFIPKGVGVSKDTGSKYNQAGEVEGATISSEVYWEEYFARIGYRPAHVIYYDASQTPTVALRKWEEDNGIDTEVFVSELTDSRITREQANQTDTRKEMERVAWEMLDERFPMNDDFFSELFTIENGEDVQAVNEIRTFFLRTDVERQAYEKYKEARITRRYRLELDPDYEQTAARLDGEKLAAYHSYLDALYDWKQNSQSTPPPFPPQL